MSTWYQLRKRENVHSRLLGVIETENHVVYIRYGYALKSITLLHIMLSSGRITTLHCASFEQARSLRRSILRYAK